MVPVRKKQFTFDAVYGSSSVQRSIYDKSVYPLVENFFNGYNATVLAYGQTGSGKTYTMGTTLENFTELESYGVIPRAMNTIFSLIDKEKENNPKAEFYLRVQFLELYGEEIRDLLSNTRDKSLFIRETTSNGVSVSGAIEENVASAEDMFSALERGSLYRTTASTNMNLHSSRSHAIFTIIMEQHLPRAGVENLMKDGKNNTTMEEEIEYRTAKFHFVDLAGSERAKRTGATGKRLQEGININMGLLALGNVISALGAKGDQHKTKLYVPYRSSKLTRLLQDSLGGNSKTLIIACISPSSNSVDESLNTLRYANRAKNIRNKPILNTDPASSQISLLKREIKRLKEQLESSESGMSDFELEQQLLRLIDDLNEEKVAHSRLKDNFLSQAAENDVLKEKLSRLGAHIPTTTEINQKKLEKSHVLDLEKEIEELNNELKKVKQTDLGEDSAEMVEVNVEEMKRELKDFELTKKEIMSLAESDNEEEENDEQTVLLKEKFLKSQRNLKTLVKSYDNTLKQKEAIMKQVIGERQRYNSMKESLEHELKALQAEVELTRRHRKELDRKVKQLETITQKSSSSSKDVKIYQKQLDKLRVQIRSKDEKLRNLAKAEKKLKETKKHEEKLIFNEKRISREISEMKRQKVEFQRQMEENSRRYRDELQARKHEIARLRKKQLTLEREKSKFENKTRRDEQLLKIKSEKLVAIQRKFRAAQKIQRQPSRKEIAQAVAKQMHKRDVRERLRLKDQIEKYQQLLKKKDQALARKRYIEKLFLDQQQKSHEKVTREVSNDNSTLKRIFDSVKPDENEFSELKILNERTIAEVEFRNEQLENLKMGLTAGEENCVEDDSPTLQENDLSDLDNARKVVTNKNNKIKFLEITIEKLRLKNKMLSGIIDSGISDPCTVGDKTKRQSKIYQLTHLEKKVESLQFKDKKWKDKQVFDRLTSVDHFTGIHKRKALDRCPQSQKFDVSQEQKGSPKGSTTHESFDTNISSKKNKISLKEYMLQEKRKRKQASLQ